MFYCCSYCYLIYAVKSIFFNKLFERGMEQSHDDVQPKSLKAIKTKSMSRGHS